ncbi:hypothetical protein [Pelosinus sp. IPA-1]|uniref:hypothetical protein n=1 Tax=Pelosinus sp. IPA-1 TaxID=3029569 RepID=UPI0024362A02|nr:hypothetical protein [Pelosinus sp. IPA-1]GMA98266.1 hypothetical protein PIPA1_10660 [Pelosinus sp. IPA-1]
MKSYISQNPIASNNCGAFSIAYYLWETNKAHSLNDKAFVDNIHKKIQVGANNIGIPEIYSSPEKMSNELSNNWDSHAYACMSTNSALMSLAKALNISTENINVLDKIKTGDNKYAIIICTVGYLTQAIHYMLVKYESNTFKLLDSLYNMDHTTFKFIDSFGMNQVVWENFVVEDDNRLSLERASSYYYTGAGILLE